MEDVAKTQARIDSEKKRNIQFNYYVMRYLWSRIPNAKMMIPFHDMVNSSRQRIVSIINTGIARYYEDGKSDIVGDIGIPIGILDGDEPFFDFYNNRYPINITLTYKKKEEQDEADTCENVSIKYSVELKKIVSSYFSFREGKDPKWDLPQLPNGVQLADKAIAKAYEKGLNNFIKSRWESIAKSIDNPYLQHTAFNNLCYFIKNGELRSTLTLDEKLNIAVNDLKKVCTFEHLEDCTTDGLSKAGVSLKTILDDINLIIKYRKRTKK